LILNSVGSRDLNLKEIEAVYFFLILED